MKYWEVIADGLSAAGFSWGYISFIDSAGRMMFCVDAHRNDGKRYIVHAYELLTAFLELEWQVKLTYWQKALSVSQ